MPGIQRIAAFCLPIVLMLLIGCTQQTPVTKRNPLLNYVPPPHRVPTATVSTGSYPKSNSLGRLPMTGESTGTIRSYRSTGRYPASTSLGIKPFAAPNIQDYPKTDNIGTWRFSRSPGQLPTRENIGAVPLRGQSTGVLPRE